ncbi:MAG: prolyl oligopeptidase family serine peptidase [Calditrichaeota bacterium]|nr:prolyl oligopeptidase family serine peptidase [Calditrichota bacterium]
MIWKNLRVLVALLLVVVLTQSAAPQERQDLSVEEIFTSLSREIYRNYPTRLKWLPKSDRFSYIQSDREAGVQKLIVHQARNGKESVVLTSDDLKHITADDTIEVSLYAYQWLPDESGLIFDSENDIWYFPLKTRQLIRLTNTPEKEEEIQISPDSRKVAFVRDFNIYVIDLATGEEKQLTFDGHADLLNGKLDWVYQEELVGRGIFRGYWWAPNSQFIAYLQFNEEPVPQYPLVDWMPYHPTVEMMRYPKAGDPNPIVKLGVVNLNTAKTVWIDTGENTDIYLPRVYWLPTSDQLAFMRLDRYQQHLEFLFADIQTGESRLVLEERDPYFINVGDFVYFFKNSPRFIWGSERTGFRHLYLYDYNGKQIRQLTRGDWMVTQFLGVDKNERWVYFTATEKDIRERHLYRVKTNGSGFKRLTQREGTHSIALSASGNYFVDTYSHVFTPYEMFVYKSSGKQLRLLRASEVDIAAKYNVRLPEFFTFEGDNGITYYASMIKPPDFNPERTYPVLVYVYGGPHAQVIRKRYGGFRFLWHLMLAQKGYIIFSMDNRGSWGRGHDWEKVVYRQLGKYELEDQLRGVAYLKNLPYVDKDRIGIWGWSYGGYMTLYAMTRSKVFKAGISVAPVTDWRDYDTIYTERYMGLPQENEEGYRNSSPVFFADSLHGHLLLVHGTGDDNVHFQNSIHMVDRLIDAGKQFEFMVYPQQMHGIGSTTDRIHLFNMMTQFLERYLKQE